MHIARKQLPSPSIGEGWGGVGPTLLLGELARLASAAFGDVIQIEEILGQAAPGIADVVKVIRADDVTPQASPRLPA
jgi:hypothetical protein